MVRAIANWKVCMVQFSTVPAGSDNPHSMRTYIIVYYSTRTYIENLYYSIL